MSNRVSRKALKSTVAIAAVFTAAVTITGCSTFGMSDSTVTGSTGYSAAGSVNQPMPSALNGNTTRVAEGQFTPPADIGSNGSGGSGGGFTYGNSAMSAPSRSTGSITSQDLPALSSSSSNGNLPAMPAQQQSYAPAPVAPRTASLGNTSTVPVSTAPALAVVPSNAYIHVVESGESLYTIARRYDITAQAIIHANNFNAPEKLFVGQKLIIPGRPDLLQSKEPARAVAAAAPAMAPAVPHHGVTALVPEAAPPTHVASLGNEPGLPVDSTVPTLAPKPLGTMPQPLGSRPVAARPAGVQPAGSRPITAQVIPTEPAAAAPVRPAPTQVASLPAHPAAPAAALQEPAMSGADKFRWPVSGKVITTFAASKATGINIAAPEGAPVRAAENGTVIYVGSGVEGYGNLVLIRHANGYVSAYAHLKSMTVAKGDVVNRGDSIGAAGMTGSVSTPQLHFELRKGATPVDPVPLLAG
jgi:murein DD-endopeptidase MepM/ murein hydrolase activator NlpD